MTDMKKYEIHYEKTFLSGLLKGITVPCSFSSPEDAAPIRVAYLERCTEMSPGRDVITRDKYVVSHISVEVIE